MSPKPTKKSSRLSRNTDCSRLKQGGPQRRCLCILKQPTQLPHSLMWHCEKITIIILIKRKHTVDNLHLNNFTLPLSANNLFKGTATQKYSPKFTYPNRNVFLTWEKKKKEIK